MIISNGNIERGNVIRIPSENILAIVLETRATLTSLRDLIRNHNITIPNSLLLNAKVEIINTESRKGVDDFVDFNIGYDTSSEAAQQYLKDVWKNACKLSSTINSERDCNLKLVNNGDHAVTWRLLYNLKAVHGLVEARNSVNFSAFELQDKHKVKLATPLTHTFPNGSPNTA
jgi:hypothetical protein